MTNREEQNGQSRTPNNQPRMTNDQSPIANDQSPIREGPVANNEWSIANNERPITNDERPITNGDLTDREWRLNTYERASRPEVTSLGPRGYLHLCPPGSDRMYPLD